MLIDPKTAMNHRPMKRRRRNTGDLYDFCSFPAAGEQISGAPFRTAVRCFLSRHAEPAFPINSPFDSLVTWQILFRPGDGVAGGEEAGVTLYVVEEDVTKTTRSIYCDQCRVVGWSGHPVCRKRYHFIIPADKNSFIPQSPLPEQEQGEGTSNSWKVCGNLVDQTDFLRCKYCDYSVIDEDNNMEQWLYPQLENGTHLLHGMVHSNGYGHLLTLNGKEGGSTILCGRDLLNFWDRLCHALAVRNISVMDVSKRYGMEYRLLHAVTYGRSWYGNWGYEFGVGCYGTTLDAYNGSVTDLSSMSLSLFAYQGRGPRNRLQELIALYQSISEVKLATLRDLLSFIFLLIHKSHSNLWLKIKEHEKLDCSSPEAECKWPEDEVKKVEEAMIKVLLAATGGDRCCWVSRRALKGAHFRKASTELLDYCLKHLEGKQASNGLVVRSRFQNSSGIEYRLESSSSDMCGPGLYSNQPSKEQLVNDLKFVYDSFFNPQMSISCLTQPTKEIMVSYARKILDCKHFVKDYKPGQPVHPTPYWIYIWCHGELEGQSKDDPRPPPELLILPENVSVADLKLEASRAFQEVYVIFKRFEAEKMLDYGPLDDSMTLKLLVGSSGSIRICGSCPSRYGFSRFRMERGVDNWIVNCMCGAKDDDGEKMLACDECETWLHTRCAGIDDNDPIPAAFVCTRCLNPDLIERKDGSDYIRKTKKPGRPKNCGTIVKGNGRRHMSIFNQPSSVHY